ncbi:MAG: hypothetical protein U0570_13920 [Phycisphaerales bacterium]
MTENTLQEHPPRSPGVLARLLGSKSLWLAILVTAVSAAWWGYSALKPASAPPAGVSSFGAADRPSPSRGQPPAAFRYGISFIAAFLAAFAVKKVLRSVLLVSALLFGAIVAIKYLGLFDFDWDSAQKQVEHGVELAKNETQKYGESLFKALPSGIAAALGAVFGARRG